MTLRRSWSARQRPARSGARRTIAGICARPVEVPCGRSAAPRSSISFERCRARAYEQSLTGDRDDHSLLRGSHQEIPHAT